MSNLYGFAISLAVIGSLVLIVFGVKLALRSTQDRLRGLLMVIAGIVILANVYLYTSMPVSPEPVQSASPRQQ